jgi:hypothetical protein
MVIQTFDYENEEVETEDIKDRYKALYDLLTTHTH